MSRSTLRYILLIMAPELLEDATIEELYNVATQKQEMAERQQAQAQLLEMISSLKGQKQYWIAARW